MLHTSQGLGSPPQGVAGLLWLSSINSRLLRHVVPDRAWALRQSLMMLGLCCVQCLRLQQAVFLVACRCGCWVAPPCGCGVWSTQIPCCHRRPRCESGDHTCSPPALLTKASLCWACPHELCVGALLPARLCLLAWVWRCLGWLSWRPRPAVVVEVIVMVVVVVACTPAVHGSTEGSSIMLGGWGVWLSFAVW